MIYDQFFDKSELSDLRKCMKWPGVNSPKK